MSVLDNPVWTALSTTQATVAERTGDAARFQDDFAFFAGLADDTGWPDLARLTGANDMLVVVGADRIPAGWEVLRSLPGVQLVAADAVGEPDDEAVVLTEADVPEMLDLVQRTKPGPFRKRTIELGTYLGVRRDGALVAMAGERFRPPGWTEMSAVCTDPAYRGHGFAARLIRAVTANILARGDQVFLHTTADNAPAIRVYERLGFEIRRPMSFTSVRVAR